MSALLAAQSGNEARATWIILLIIIVVAAVLGGSKKGPKR